MTTTRNFVAAALFCALVTTSGYAGKPNTVSPVPLIVTFDDSLAIASDDGRPYTDGVDGISAAFDQYGNLIIDFQTTRTPLRKVHYDYGEPLFGGSALLPADPPDNYLSTVRLPGGGPLQMLPTGASQCVRAYFTYTDDARTTQYRLAFQRATGTIDVSDSSYLRVVKTTAGWDVTSDGALDADGNCVSRHDPLAIQPGAFATVLIETPLSGKWSFVSDGYYDMPMQLTLTAK